MSGDTDRIGTPLGPEQQVPVDRQAGLEPAGCPQRPSEAAVVKWPAWCRGGGGPWGPSAQSGRTQAETGRKGARCLAGQASGGSVPPARGRGRWRRRDSEPVRALPAVWRPHCVSLRVEDLRVAAIPAGQAALESGLRNGPSLRWACLGLCVWGVWLGQPFSPRVLGFCGSWEGCLCLAR